MPKTAYSYIRFSTKGQITGDSLQRQLKGARDYAAKHGLILDEHSYQDLGISAFKGKNATEGALKAFLDAVDDGTIPNDTTLLVENFDRLSRNDVNEALDLFSGITKRGITIVTLSDGQVYNRKSIAENWTKLIISLATMARAHEESATKSMRVRSGKLKALEDGKKHGKCPAWLKVSDDRRSFIIIEEQANIVREVFRMRAESIGAHRIAKHLNATYGWKWSAPQVARLLQNPSVIGTRVSQAKYAPILNYYPAIISNTEYYDIQRLMSGGVGTKRGRRAEDEPNLFTGLVFCAHCAGRTRFFRANRATSQRYVRCENALNGLCAVEGYVNYDALEKEVIGWLLLDQDEDFISLLDKKPTPKVTVNAEVVKLKEQQARLIDLAASGVMNSQLIAERLNALEMEIQHHETVVVPPETEERMFAEKAWALVERHDDELLAVADGEDAEKLYAVRRELKTAFQRSLERINVYPEIRHGDEHLCKFSVKFRGYDGEPVREYKRPALNHVKGAWNKGRSH